MSILKNKITLYCGAVLLALGSTIFKISYLFGSAALFFSGINVVVPVMGLFGSMYAALVFFGAISVVKLLLFPSIPAVLATQGIIAFCAILLFKLHLPTFCASMGLRTNHWFFHGVIPALCMFLFMLHPVGRCAAPYSFYWFIPMVICGTQRRDFFSRALASTFIAHAVGSVLWLYSKVTTPALWIGLLPVVFFERLLFAAGMTLVYTCLCMITKKQLFPPLRKSPVLCLKIK